ncbi:phosphate ABC transporter substrate-binding protein [Spirosoma litoris]
MLIKGSDTEVNLVLGLAEAYMARDSACSLAITGGGSGLGIAALLNGKTQLANSSRDLNSEECQLAKDRGIRIYTFVFARDAIAIIVNKAVPIRAISLSDLANLYAGGIMNWKTLGGQDAPISLYGRQNSSGTYIYLRQKVVKKEYSSKIRELNGSAQLIQAVSEDPNGIGYVSVGYIQESKVKKAFPNIKVLLIADPQTGKTHSPYDKRSVENETYPLTRPLYQFVNGQPKGTLRQFMQFELSPKGREIIASMGYFPISQTYHDQNKRNGLNL